MEFNLCFTLDAKCTIQEEAFVIDPSVKMMPSFKEIQEPTERRKIDAAQSVNFVLLLV